MSALGHVPGAIAAFTLACGAVLGCAQPSTPVPSLAPPQAIELPPPPSTVASSTSSAAPAASFAASPVALAAKNLNADAGPASVRAALAALAAAPEEPMDLHEHPTGTASSSPSIQPRSVMAGATQVVGRLPPEVVHRGVRGSYGRYAYCYDVALRSAPSLAGRLTVRLVIGPDGVVKSSVAGSTDLRDPVLVQCAVAVFGKMTFPKPEGGGDVVVTYPVVFSPGDASPPAPPHRP